MKKLCIVFAIASIMVIACGKNDAPDFAAAEAARDYYQQLVQGNYEQYVSGMINGDSLPADYREQLVANAKMFIAHQNDLHKGISTITVQNCVNDNTTSTAQAFLLLNYADSTSEEIVVPMVKQNDIWYMK